MLCNRCLRAAQRTQRTHNLLRQPTRTITTTTPQSATISPNAATQSAPRQGAPSSSHHPPSATSTSAAQPFSAGTSTSPKKLGIAKSASPPALFKSSVPAGTPLKGLNFIKGKGDPVALEDGEYPGWLWTVLGEEAGDKSGAGSVDEADLYAKSAKARRRAAKALRKQQLLNPEALVPKVPVHEQSVDLPVGKGNVDALGARADLTKSMRDKRRAAIKEDNFLRTMG